jgi:hypothetical protein
VLLVKKEILDQQEEVVKVILGQQGLLVISEQQEQQEIQDQQDRQEQLVYLEIDI